MTCPIWIYSDRGGVGKCNIILPDAVKSVLGSQLSESESRLDSANVVPEGGTSPWVWQRPVNRNCPHPDEPAQSCGPHVRYRSPNAALYKRNRYQRTGLWSHYQNLWRRAIQLDPRLWECVALLGLTCRGCTETAYRCRYRTWRYRWERKLQWIRIAFPVPVLIGRTFFVRTGSPVSVTPYTTIAGL